MNYDLDSYRDNTDNGSGILRFGKDCFPARFSFEYNAAQRDMVRLFFMLLDPRRQTAIDRQAYFLVHRECGKTSVGNFLFTMFMIYMYNQLLYLDINYLGWTEEDKKAYSQYLISPNSNIIEIRLDENYITLASETLDQAFKYIEALKSIIEDRDDLMKVFGEKHPNFIQYAESSERRKKTKTDTWNIRAFRTADGIYVEAAGANSRYRGSTNKGFRPSFIVLDDIYSESNTKTEMSRHNVDRWIYAAIKNTLSTQRGKILWLGTMVHPDTIIKDFRHPDTKWFGISRPIISMAELTKAVKQFTVSGKLVIPSYLECMEIQKQYDTLSWPSYHTLYSILTKYQENMIKDTLTYFYQEYMNEALAPENVMFSPDIFQKLDLRFRIENDRQIVYFKYKDIDWYGICNLYCGVDPASSDSIKSDDTVIVVAGYVRCYPIVPGREIDYSYSMDIHGNIFPIIAELRAGKYATTEYNNMPGIAETLLELDKRYKLQYINVEMNGQQEQMIRQIRTIFTSNEKYATIKRNAINKNPRAKICDEVSVINKAVRIRSTLYPVIQAHKTVICNKYIDVDKMYSQLIMLGFADHDDYPDAWAIAMKNVKIPKKENILTDRKDTETKSRIDNLIEKYGNDWRYYL